MPDCSGSFTKRNFVGLLGSCLKNTSWRLLLWLWITPQYPEFWIASISLLALHFERFIGQHCCPLFLCISFVILIVYVFSNRRYIAIYQPLSQAISSCIAGNFVHCYFSGGIIFGWRKGCFNCSRQVGELPWSTVRRWVKNKFWN